MKTSNKLLLTVVIIAISYLVIYDFSLGAEYLKGDYKTEFYHMHKQPISSFETVEHNAANIFNVKIEKGPEYAIWLSNNIDDQVIIDQHNQTLAIACKDKNGHFRSINQT